MIREAKERHDPGRRRGARGRADRTRLGAGRRRPGRDHVGRRGAAAQALAQQVGRARSAGLPDVVPGAQAQLAAVCSARTASSSPTRDSGSSSSSCPGSRARSSCSSATTRAARTTSAGTPTRPACRSGECRRSSPSGGGDPARGRGRRARLLVRGAGNRVPRAAPRASACPPASPCSRRRRVVRRPARRHLPARRPRRRTSSRLLDDDRSASNLRQVGPRVLPRRTAGSASRRATSRSGCARRQPEGGRMPSAYTYPGVYVEEVPSGVRTIAGVSTRTRRSSTSSPAGRSNQAVRVTGLADFERVFGGCDRDERGELRHPASTT